MLVRAVRAHEQCYASAEARVKHLAERLREQHETRRLSRGEGSEGFEMRLAEIRVDWRFFPFLSGILIYSAFSSASTSSSVVPQLVTSLITERFSSYGHQV